MEFTGERYIPCKETENQPIEREHWQRYYFAQSIFTESSCILDIASGEGYGSDFLAQKLKYVTGVDINKEAIEHASKKYRRDNLHFCTGDVTKIPLDNCSQDGIVSFETIEHVDEQAQLKFLEESKRILKSDGIFVVSCPNKSIASDFAYELWGYTNIYHKKEYEIDAFECLLKKFFKNVKLLYQRTETNLVLSGTNPEYLKVIWGERKTTSDTQNIIAVCSDVPVLDMIPELITLDIDNSYLKFQKNYADIFKANAENVKEISNCQVRLTELQNQSQTLQKNLFQSQNELDNLKNQNQFLISLNTEQQEALNTLKAENSSQKEALSTLSSENAMQQEALKLSTVERDEYRQISDQRFEKIKKLEAEMTDLQNELQRRLDQLDLMENSRSWKITKPLRTIAHAFRNPED